jgi:hypothetical protein
MRRGSTGLLKVTFGVSALCAIAVIAFALSPTSARADEITLGGSANGIFCASLPCSSGPNTLLGMTFTGNTGFSQTTSGGVAALDLGSFSLNQTSSIYSGYFALNILFTSPLISTTTDVATVFGSVAAPFSGGVWVFNFSPETIDFTDSSGNAEDFELAVNPVSVTPGSTGTPLTAFVFYTGSTGGSGGTVPEPPTMALASLGIAGVFLLKKRLLLA